MVDCLTLAIVRNKNKGDRQVASTFMLIEFLRVVGLGRWWLEENAGTFRVHILILAWTNYESQFPRISPLDYIVIHFYSRAMDTLFTPFLPQSFTCTTSMEALLNDSITDLNLPILHTHLDTMSTTGDNVRSDISNYRLIEASAEKVVRSNEGSSIVISSTMAPQPEKVVYQSTTR